MFTIPKMQLTQRWTSRACLLVAFRCTLLFLILYPAGCQTLSLPSIDPTGNRIFDINRPLQFINPHDPNNGYPSIAPAYQHPPTPPKCLQTGDKKLCQGCLSGKGCLLGKKKAAEEMRGRCGELLITPNRLVAPVGGEVIILAGICGKDDNLVTGEAIEWMLAPESVGQIVEVGDDAKGKRQSFWKTSTGPKVEKLGVDYARGRTSSEPGLITKGTADVSDDLPIRKGQTWLSLTSPSEGVSKVTVLAPDSDVWDKRRQTATIYWIDASWEFPQPQVAGSDAAVPLETKVLRSDNFIPATDWIVRYRSLNPDFAKFVSQGSGGAGPGMIDTIEARVDANGIAKVYLQRIEGPSIPKNGVAPIEVEIIRPAQVSENMPELPLARATTTVTWNAPELVLDSIGPDRAAPGRPSQYWVKISNIGGMPADNVRVFVTVPPIMRFDSASHPPSQQTNNELIWNIGALDARRVAEISFQLTPINSGDARIIFDLQASPGIKQQRSIATLIEGASLELQFAPKPNMAEVPVNSTVTFDCVLTNRSNQSLQNLRVLLESNQGLVHDRTGDTQVQQPVGSLAAGQSINLSPVFRVTQPGEFRISTRVFSDAGQLMATATTSVRGVGSAAPPPITPPGFGQPNTGVPNNSGSILPGAGVPGAGPPGAPPPMGNPGIGNPGIGNPSGNDGIQPPSSGLPGLPGLPPAGGPVESSARPAIGSGVATGAEQDAKLAISIQPMVQFIKRGDTVTYDLRVENLLEQSDQKVAIAFAIPKGARLISVRAQGLDYRTLDDRGIVELTPIQYFRPRDSFRIQVQLKHEESQTQTIVASVKSRNQVDAVSSSILVRVQ